AGAQGKRGRRRQGGEFSQPGGRLAASRHPEPGSGGRAAASGKTPAAERDPTITATVEHSGRRGRYRQANPPPARHRPGARSARRQRRHSTVSQTTCERECPMTTTLPRPRCRPQLEALEDRLVPSVDIDMVLQWNGVTRDAIRAAGTSAPAASRLLAITHAAVYDAVNALDRTHEVYRVD